MPGLTVIICTHNPREAYLQETLAALRRQTTPIQSWELLVIDNASREPLAGRLDLDWHPRARIVREDNLGIAHARARALHEATEARSELILFVDDDNILAADYIEQGLQIGNIHTEIGCWGGQLLPRYEVEPPEWLENYKKYLAIFPLEKALVAGHVESYDVVPPTAGTFVRRAVWLKYLDLVKAHSLRLVLGPKGKVRIGGEDMDLMLSANDLGLGLGRFPQLKLQHIMPRERLTPEYMEGLLTSITLGTGILEFIRHERMPAPVNHTLFNRLRNRWRASRLPDPIGRFFLAELAGQARATQMINEWKLAQAARAFRNKT